jgi:hypothetical protein
MSELSGAVRRLAPSNWLFLPRVHTEASEGEPSVLWWCAFLCGFLQAGFLIGLGLCCSCVCGQSIELETSCEAGR